MHLTESRALAKKRRAGSSRYCQSGVGETGQVERHRYTRDAAGMKTERSSTSIIGAHCMIKMQTTGIRAHHEFCANNYLYKSVFAFESTSVPDSSIDSLSPMFIFANACDFLEQNKS